MVVDWFVFVEGSDYNMHIDDLGCVGSALKGRDAVTDTDVQDVGGFGGLHDGGGAAADVV